MQKYTRLSNFSVQTVQPIQYNPIEQIGCILTFPEPNSIIISSFMATKVIFVSQQTFQSVSTRHFPKGTHIITYNTSHDIMIVCKDKTHNIKNFFPNIKGQYLAQINLNIRKVSLVTNSSSFSSENDNLLNSTKFQMGHLTLTGITVLVLVVVAFLLKNPFVAKRQRYQVEKGSNPIDLSLKSINFEQ